MLKDLAWVALFDTGTFKKIYPEGSDARTRIVNRNAARDHNITQKVINPKSSPCK